MALSQGEPIALESDDAYDKRLGPLAKREADQLGETQRYLRGLYCGGSLAEEALTLAQKKLGPLYGNIAFDEAHSAARFKHQPRRLPDRHGRGGVYPWQTPCGH